MKRPRGRRLHKPRLWTHSLQYRAERWDRPRRVILVVKERPDDLLLDRFFLVTSLTWPQMAKSAVLEHYRERGKAEGHMGELKDVLNPALSSNNWPKIHVRGRKSRSAAPAIDAFACNEVRLLISLIAYQLTVLLTPLTVLIKAHVRAATRLHGDDTTVPLLARGGMKTARLWTYVRDDRPFDGTAPPAVVFHFSRARGGEHPTEHLQG